jgi:hypothetical protein
MPGAPIQGVNAGSSWVDVCNTALRALGMGRIANLTGTDPSSLACADLLPDAITSVCSASDDWACLRARAQLVIDPLYVPVNDYLYAYSLPADCSDFNQNDVEAIDAPAVGSLPNPQPYPVRSTFRWSREDRWILTNATLVYLRYNRNPVQSDAATLPDWFLHAVHDQLAVNLCMPLRQNVGLLKILDASAAKTLSAALANDDKMKYKASARDTRGYGYYEETRMTGGDVSNESDPYNRNW